MSAHTMRAKPLLLIMPCFAAMSLIFAIVYALRQRVEDATRCVYALKI